MSKEKPLSHSESNKIIHEQFLEWLKKKEKTKKSID